MAVATFDTLKFANALKAAGVPDKQAEAEAAVISEALAANFKELATKDDLRSVKDELTGLIRETEQKLNAKSDALEQRFNNKIDSVEQRLNNKIDTLAVKVFGEMMLLKWMLGLTITLSVGILIRLFFVRGV